MDLEREELINGKWKAYKVPPLLHIKSKETEKLEQFQEEANEWWLSLDSDLKKLFGKVK